MKLTIGFSPCPNDTYIFDALVNGKINTGGLEFEVIMEDVQTLNEMAIAGRIDISKISYGTLPLVLENYILLNTGGALGMGVGPLLISKIPLPPPAISQCVIAIPGRHTTAHVLFSLAYPEAINKVFLRYDEIEDYVLGGNGSLENIHSVKLGVIIHENRFTYQDKGLTKLMDLGNYWETETGLPVPLGGIVGKRSIEKKVLKEVERLIGESLAYSRGVNELSEFVKENALEMSEDVMRMHIGLYVNDYTADLGDVGRNAVKKFVQVHSAINKIPVDAEGMFLG